MIALNGPLKVWANNEGRMHFMTVPEEISGEIKARALMDRRGFGSVRVEVTLRDVTWRTSVFPSKDNGGYFLPVKMDVVRKTDLAVGDEITLTLELL
jgi:hypothetical protein